MKQKNLTIIFSIIAIIIASTAFFVASQNKGPRITELPTYATEHTPAATATQIFSFGEMENIYKDTEFGFLLKYPDEIGVAQVQKSCHMDLYLMDATMGYPPFISLYNSSCPSPFVNLSAQSIDDYKKDYTLDNGVAVSIVNTENISSPLGLQAVRQEYFTFSNVQEMQNSNLSARTPSVRYVFYNKEKGFYVLQVAYLSDTQNTYKELERKIIETVQY